MNIRKDLKFKIYKNNTRLLFGNVDLQMTNSFKEYRFKNPNSLISLNSEIYQGKDLIWYGDLDLSKSISKFYKLVDKLKKDIQIYNSGEFKNNIEPLLTITVNHEQKIRKEESKFYEFNKTLDAYIKKSSTILPEHFNGDYNKENYIKKIKVPSFSNFDYLNDKISPFDFFYKEILLNMNIKIEDVILDSSKMIISKLTLDLLLDHFEKWLLDAKIIEDRSYELKERIDFARKNISPLVFEGSIEGPEWAEKDSVYIKESFYEKK